MPEQPAASQEVTQGTAGTPNTAAHLGAAYAALGSRIVDGVVQAGYPQRPAHSAVMAHIDIDGGTRLTTIAARANVTPQAVGELVDDLERRGYVRREPDPDDRRAKRVCLTERGRACVGVALDTIAILESEIEELLGSQRYADLHASLSEIVAKYRG